MTKARNNMYEVSHDTRPFTPVKITQQLPPPRPVKKKKRHIGLIFLLILLLSATAAGIYIYAQYVYEPEPIPVHAIYKRTHWAPKERDVGLISYGDEVIIKIDTLKYFTTCDNIVVWHDHEDEKHINKSDQQYLFEITTQTGTILKGRCYEPVTPKDQENCVILDTDTTRYYTDRRNVKLTPVT